MKIAAAGNMLVFLDITKIEQKRLLTVAGNESVKKMKIFLMPSFLSPQRTNLCLHR